MSYFAPGRVGRVLFAGFSSVVLFLLVQGCTDRGLRDEKPVGRPLGIVSPRGLPSLSVPAANLPTAETVALGRRLFFEKRLSADNSLACASCHDPQLGFSDRLKLSRGVGGKLGTRNAPPVVNAAFYPAQFWDGRAGSLEEQAAGPIGNPIEMNEPHQEFIAKLAVDSSYKSDFERAFGPGPITIGRVEKALASYERTLLSGNSAFDRYEFAGDKSALSPAAQRGLAIFRDKDRGNCTACHSMQRNYALFEDGKFHNIGIGVNEEGEITDSGRFAVTGIDSDKGAFKTPGLRNVAITAP